MSKNRLFFDKIEKIHGVCLFTLLVFTLGISGQEIRVIDKARPYWQTVKRDSLQRMVELKTIIPGLEYDMRYATTGNFTGKKLYNHGRYTFLRKPAAMALAVVETQLEKKGLGLKIFDAYRPYHATVLMWNLVHDERYVANPAKGSGHNRGLSVDLTLIDLETGNEL